MCIVYNVYIFVSAVKREKKDKRAWVGFWIFQYNSSVDNIILQVTVTVGGVYSIWSLDMTCC